MRDLTRYNAKYPAHLMSKDKKRESDNPPRWYKYGSHHPRKAWTLYLGRGTCRIAPLLSSGRNHPGDVQPTDTHYRRTT